MKNRFIAALIAAFFIVVAACQHKIDQPSTGPGNPSNPSDTALCFERDILPIFISNCAKSGCHDAGTRSEGFEFTSYATIVAREFKAGDPSNCELYEKIMETDPDEIMPPPPNTPLTGAEKALIRRWIEEGAKNTTGCATLCDSGSFTYSGAIKPMLDKYCVGCHNGSLASGGVTLHTYAGAADVAAKGWLLGVIKHDTGFPAMPQGGSKLSDCQIKQVEKWIAAGYPNN